jgi:hypothetical protein
MQAVNEPISLQLVLNWRFSISVDTARCATPDLRLYSSGLP